MSTKTPNSRQLLLLAEVRSGDSVSVEVLVEQFPVTLQTGRPDFELLADAALLARFHGGVRVQHLLSLTAMNCVTCR